MNVFKTLIFSCLLLPVVGGCGDDTASGPEPFVIQVNSVDVVPEAVTKMQIVLEPSRAGQMFEMVPDSTAFGGDVSTRVSGAGEFVIEVEAGYIARERRAPTSPGAFMWNLEVPVRSVSNEDDPAVGDPNLRVTFLRGTDRIAEGLRFLIWPPPPEQRAVVNVSCQRGSEAQCMNMAGTPMPDAGASD